MSMAQWWRWQKRRTERLSRLAVWWINLSKQWHSWLTSQVSWRRTGYLSLSLYQVILPLLHPSIAMTVLQTSQTSRFIDSSRSTTSAIHQSLLTQLTSLRDDASAAVGTVNETGINFAIARAILVSTNSTLTSKPLQLPDYKTSFTGFYLQLPNRSWRQEGHSFKWRRERGRETRES